MSGLTDLKQTLESLKVICDDVEYGFASIETESQVSLQQVLATFQENGRLAIIAPQEYLRNLSIEHEGPYAKLTVDVHTSLDLVGLTAAMASTLADNGISANVVAAFYHDYVF